MITRSAYDRAEYYRKGYVRADGVKVAPAHVPATHVPAARIPMRGDLTRAHKGPKLIPMADSRHLGEFGYNLKKRAEVRRKALDRSVKERGYAFTMHRVNAVATLLKNTEPVMSHRAKADVKYLESIKKA